MPWIQEGLIGTIDGTNAAFTTSKIPSGGSLEVWGGGTSQIFQVPSTFYVGSAVDGTGNQVVFQPGHIPQSGPQGASELWALYFTGEIYS